MFSSRFLCNIRPVKAEVRGCTNKMFIGGKEIHIVSDETSVTECVQNVIDARKDEVCEYYQCTYFSNYSMIQMPFMLYPCQVCCTNGDTGLHVCHGLHFIIIYSYQNTILNLKCASTLRGKGQPGHCNHQVPLNIGVEF